MDSDLMRWVKAQADDPNANPRFRELLAALEAAREDAERWRALRELDGGEIYELLGDCDGIHPEQADAAIAASMAKEVRND